MTVKEFLESFEVYFSGMFESKGEKFDEAIRASLARTGVYRTEICNLTGKAKVLK